MVFLFLSRSDSRLSRIPEQASSTIAPSSLTLRRHEQCAFGWKTRTFHCRCNNTKDARMHARVPVFARPHGVKCVAPSRADQVVQLYYCTMRRARTPTADWLLAVICTPGAVSTVLLTPLSRRRLCRANRRRIILSRLHFSCEISAKSTP